MKKQLLLLTLLLLSAATASAVEQEIDGLWYELIPKGKVAKVIQYKNGVKYSGDIVIPDDVEYAGDSYSVTSVGNNAFADCGGLTSVTIPNSVTSIGFNAFAGCGGLTSVTIPCSVTSVGNYAFHNCSHLNSVHISDIGAWCNISFGSSYSNPLYYAHHLYLNGEEIKDFVIPNGVTSIGTSAFSGCSGLTSVTIPNSVTSIGYYAFSGCSGLTSVTIPNSVTSIAIYAFSGCSGLTSVTIGNSVTGIEERTFSGCSGLTSVTIPGSVTSIGAGAFEGCSGLTSVTIPNSVTSIGSYAFYYCSGLTSVTIPNSVKGLGYNAFNGCIGLTSVTIGNGMKSIPNYAFASCPDLTDVYCYAESVPSTSTDAFVDSYIEYATLHVPTASIGAYAAVEPWKNFKSIVGLDGTLPESQKCATPTIAYAKGKVVFGCETEGVTFVSEIKNGDVKKHYDAELTLTPTYVITVYATKADCDDSDVATATIQWREGRPVFTGFSSVETDEQTVNDVNGDGEVGIGDIVNITNVMAGKTAGQGD